MPAWFLGHQWSGDSSGARLRQARVAKNMTIRDLDEATGLSTPTIGNLEAGRIRATLPNLLCLDQVLDVPVAYLGCFEVFPEKALSQRIKKARRSMGLPRKNLPGLSV